MFGWNFFFLIFKKISNHHLPCIEIMWTRAKLTSNQVSIESIKWAMVYSKCIALSKYWRVLGTMQSCIKVTCLMHWTSSLPIRACWTLIFMIWSCTWLDWGLNPMGVVSSHLLDIYRIPQLACELVVENIMLCWTKRAAYIEPTKRL